MDIHELEQELQIRTEQNADLYAKLCNALMQIEEANRIIGIIGCQCKHDDMQMCIDYCKKWGVK